MVRERDKRTYAIIGAAMEVQGVLGPGHLEAVYQEALEIELRLRGIAYQRKPPLTIHFKGHELETHYVPDFLVMDEVVVAEKSSPNSTAAP